MVLHYEELSMNACPSLQTMLYDGWVLRFAEGYGRRPNSVNPIYGSSLDLDEKIHKCEKLYRDKGFPVIFKLTAASLPGNLDAALQERGYSIFHPTALYTMDMPQHISPSIETIAYSSEFDEEWLNNYCSFNKVSDKDASTTRKIIHNIVPEKFFVTLFVDNLPVACGLGVLESGYMGLFDIVVKEEHRGKGYGTELILNMLKLGKANNAQKAYLQVMLSNEPAIKLYSKLGFKECYKYWYRIKE
jgi:N-acetylglutamate synthase